MRVLFRYAQAISHLWGKNLNVRVMVSEISMPILVERDLTHDEQAALPILPRAICDSCMRMAKLGYDVIGLGHDARMRQHTAARSCQLDKR